MKDKIILYDLSGKNDIRFSPPCWNVKLCLIYNNIDLRDFDLLSKTDARSKIKISTSI